MKSTPKSLIRGSENSKINTHSLSPENKIYVLQKQQQKDSTTKI